MGLLDREYMRDTPRVHLGETNVNEYGEVRTNDALTKLNEQMAARNQAHMRQIDLNQQRQRARVRRRRFVRVVQRLCFISVIVGLPAWAWQTKRLVLAYKAANSATVMVCLSACSAASHPSTLPPSKMSLPVGVGVHTCGMNAYDARRLVCKGDLSRFALRHLGVVHLSATGIDGGTFAHDKLTVNIGRALHTGGFEHLITFDVNVGLSYGVWSPTIEKLFKATHLHVQTGNTYKVEVDDGEMLLGTTTFIVVK